MRLRSFSLYHVTAGWLLLTVILGGYLLLSSTMPTGDVEAASQSDVHEIWIADIEPGEILTFRTDAKPVLIWRRSSSEMAVALAQIDSGLSVTDWGVALQDGRVAQELGAERYRRLEWFIGSPIDVGGIGCVVLPKAGDYGGFFDPCRATHFDMWGRVVKGPSEQDLQVAPSRFSANGQSVTLDLTYMPRPRGSG